MYVGMLNGTRWFHCRSFGKRKGGVSWGFCRRVDRGGSPGNGAKSAAGVVPSIALKSALGTLIWTHVGIVPV